MANTNNPHGLAPLGICLSGEQPKLRHFPVLSASVIYRNDAVSRVAAGDVQAAAAKVTAGYTGVAMQYSATGSTVPVAVMITPDALFETQSDIGGATNIAAADLGLNADLLYTTGNTLTKVSMQQIDSSTKATTASLDVKLHELYATPDNVHGDYARIVVSFNTHRNAPGVAGV